MLYRVLRIPANSILPINKSMGSRAYHAACAVPETTADGESITYFDSSDAMATWGGDVASASGGKPDWHADMDVINITNRVRNNPGEDPMKVEQDYYGRKGISEAARAREFCGNYDPEGKGDPHRGLKFIREHGMQISTGSSGSHFLGKHKSHGDQKRKLDEFTKLLQQEIG